MARSRSRLRPVRHLRSLLPTGGPLLALLLTAGPALAQQNIGAAGVVRNQVNGSLPTGAVAIAQGDSVFRDEGVRTGTESAAKLVFLDNTNVAMGPLSSIKLDRFVYSGENSTGSIAFNLAKGAFRFATGNADKKAYTITTPTATIGIRGTILEIVSTASKTSVVLQEGAAIVCTRNKDEKKRHCVELQTVGQQAVVTAQKASIVTTVPGGTQFADLCRGADGLCETSTFQDLSRFASTGEAALCGR
ncbi:MAG: FecR domain-containing protein [Methylobacteriaceae bacterium]|nr:FecR domain-containing protein [Methylobacteriaceae bacterium]MBV9243701.1 FecR domain-containing protein [Methylobacteriaceae bacterium]MBV9636015.1 FecR domain-containing protein [Methylobacteriaceae bacterium]